MANRQMLSCRPTRRQLDEIDAQAEREGQAITKQMTLKPKNRMLHKTYTIDGEQFLTGNKHKHLSNGSGG